MRRKKHKVSRRIVRFFKLHFGFREPFKVWCYPVQAAVDVHKLLRKPLLAVATTCERYAGTNGREFPACCVAAEVCSLSCVCATS